VPADPALAAEVDVVRAIDVAFEDDADGVDALLARARRHLAPDPWLLGVAANLEAFVDLLRNRFAAARAAVLAGRPYQDHAGGELSAVYGRCFEGVALAQTGDLDGAASAFELGIAIAARGSGRHGYPARMASGYLGDIRYEQNQLDVARELLEAGFSLREESGLPEMALAVYPALCRLHQARGDPDAALAVLYEGGRQAAAQGSDRLAAAIAHEEVRLHLAGGDVERAARLVDASADEPPRGAAPRRAWELRRMARARLLVAQGKPAAARRVLAPLLEAALDGGRRRLELAVRLIAVVAARAEGDADAARAELGAALALGEAQGAIRALADEGPALQALLRKWPERGSPYLARVVASFQPPAAPAAAPPTLIEPLNVRELQILRLVEEGRANKEVSAALGIGLDTVKWHLKNAYKKLGVATRTGAIHAARAAGVLATRAPPPRLKPPPGRGLG
jgi:LuxR family maltose regulon positive regulatory protein/serine/threonine-protein kinase PknK